MKKISKYLYMRSCNTAYFLQSFLVNDLINLSFRSKQSN